MSEEPHIKNNRCSCLLLRHTKHQAPFWILYMTSLISHNNSKTEDTIMSISQMRK